METWEVWLVGLGAVLVMMAITWVAAAIRTDVGLVDRVWGLAFVLLAWTYALVSDVETTRMWVVLTAVTVWGLRLSIYITWRNRGHGEDPRYAAMRAKRPDTFTRRSLITVFGLQGVLAWVISLPLLAVATRTGDLTIVDVIATVVWCVGFWFEAVGDLQLSRFLADPANKGRVMDQGLWGLTRHPNYFGDTTVWVAYGTFAAATGIGGLYGYLGSLVMGLFIVKVSGVALTERRMASERAGSKRIGYDEYVASTNAFFPGPRRS